MTLSNFDWTDKDSIKWFLLLPTGHEGPYSLSALIQLHEKKRLALDVKVWAEGLKEGLTLKVVLEKNKIVDEVPPLPPLPTFSEDDIPPLPIDDKIYVTEPETEVVKSRKAWPFILGVCLVMVIFLFLGMVKRYEKFSIRRYPKMQLETHEKIMKDFDFAGWGKEIFFKEYMPSDQSHIWLVTSSFQSCKVEASFDSMENKLLTMLPEKVSFKTNGVLADHVVEFSSFDFTEGTKIIPGLYEMDVKATDCTWDGLLPKVMNKFMPPEESYIARTKVVLFSKGPEEFNRILDKLIQKKMAIELKEKNRTESFWQDLQQKLETLQAITLQIEQLMLDLLDSGPRNFQKDLRPMVEKYTKQFGSFLTNFVIENEKYFETLGPIGKVGGSEIKNYELMIKHTSKNIGFESMKFIEEFQSLKKRPNAKELQSDKERVRSVYGRMKKEISQKIIQVSEDRSK